MKYLLYSFKYLSLRREDGSLVLWRDLLPVLFVSGLIVVPYTFLGAGKFFSEAGFLGRIGGMTANLTGFYIAGLVAVAAFASENAAIDETISTGKISSHKNDVADRNFLTRREYICYIFGYLSVITLVFSLSSVFITSISGAVNHVLYRVPALLTTKHLPNTNATVRFVGIVISSATLSHILITTGYGLYYLVEKIYDKKAVIKPKSQADYPRVSLVGSDE